MKELNLALEKSMKVPVYQRLADALRTCIRNGHLRPGENLPSTRKLAAQFRIHRHTVMNAIAELESEGWVVAFERKTYQVVATLPPTFLRSVKGNRAASLVDAVDLKFARKVAIENYPPSASFRHAFPSGFPDVRLFPMREFKSHLYDALQTKGILGYGDPAGHPKLIQEIEVYLRRLRAVTDRKFL